MPFLLLFCFVLFLQLSSSYTLKETKRHTLTIKKYTQEQTTTTILQHLGIRAHTQSDWFLNDKLRNTIDNRLKITSRKRHTQWHCILRDYTNDSNKKNTTITTKEKRKQTLWIGKHINRRTDSQAGKLFGTER